MQKQYFATAAIVGVTHAIPSLRQLLQLSTDLLDIDSTNGSMIDNNLTTLNVQEFVNTTDNSAGTKIYAVGEET